VKGAVMNICFFTGTRAEYGLLYPILKEIEDAPGLDYRLVVTGSHLSRELGETWREIVVDGFRIDRKIDLKLGSDSDSGICRSMGTGLTRFGAYLSETRPDLLLILGDRYEILAAASAALICRIPVAHISGGETTEGAYDESIRHAVTKLSHLHFTSTEEYRQRVIQLGESPERVFNVGSTSIDNIRTTPLLDRKRFEKLIGRPLMKRNLLVTYHPATLESGSPLGALEELLAVLESLDDTLILFTAPNADTAGRLLLARIETFVRTHAEHCIFHRSLGRVNYLSALQFVDAVIGNSSSGIVEVPSFHIGTVNVGDRQKGRVRAKSVIDCPPDRIAIGKAVRKAYSTHFKRILKTVESPFGDGYSAERIRNILSRTDVSTLVPKRFYDLPFATAKKGPVLYGKNVSSDG
jgi:GDP/UDP-N,N'-diacetylbacillosamine 2-epimerase (hydrolysing)